MITEYDTETATLVLPVTNIDISDLTRINQQAGSGTLIEVDFDTENYTQFYVDYSLLGIEDDSDAESHCKVIYRDICDWFGIEGIAPEFHLEQFQKEIVRREQKQKMKEFLDDIDL